MTTPSEQEWRDEYLAVLKKHEGEKLKWTLGKTIPEFISQKRTEWEAAAYERGEADGYGNATKDWPERKKEEQKPKAGDPCKCGGRLKQKDNVLYCDRFDVFKKGKPVCKAKTIILYPE